MNSRSAGDTAGAGARAGRRGRRGSHDLGRPRATALHGCALTLARPTPRDLARVASLDPLALTGGLADARLARGEGGRPLGGIQDRSRGHRHRHNLRIVMSGGGIPTEGEEHHHGEDRKPEEPRQRSRGHDRAEARHTDRGARATRITPPERRSALRSAGPASRARAGGLRRSGRPLCALAPRAARGRGSGRGSRRALPTAGLQSAGHGKSLASSSGSPGPGRAASALARSRGRRPPRSTPPSSFAISPPSPYARLTECGKLMIASRERNAQAMKSCHRASSQAPLGRSDWPSWRRHRRTRCLPPARWRPGSG